MRNILAAVVVAFVAVSCGSSTEETTATAQDSVQVETGIKVVLKQLSPERFEHYFEVNGTVESAHDIFLSPEMSGQIKTIAVSEGQKVTKGQIIATLNTSVISNSIKEVETQLELAQKTYEKQKALWDQNIGSEIQFLQAKTNFLSLQNRLDGLRSQYEMSIIKAPVDGVIDEIFQKEGEVTAPGARFAQLINLDELYINADVAESYVTKIKKGDTVAVHFPSLGNEFDQKLTIYRTGNSINPGNRTYTVQIKIQNRDNLIKPNAICYVNVRDYVKDSALVVPSKIIQRDSKGTFLYKAAKKDGKQIAQKTYINVGFVNGATTEVFGDNIQVNDKIVVEGYNRVSNGIEIYQD